MIELLVVIGTLGVLAGLALTNFYVYRDQAYYSIVQSTLRDGRTALEAGVNPDSPSPAVPASSVVGPGVPSDAGVAALMPGLRLPKSVKVDVQYDPACGDSSCQSAAVKVAHCRGSRYSQFVRAGDGVEVLLERVAGTGCP